MRNSHLMVGAYSVFGGAQPLRHIKLAEATAEHTAGRARWICRKCSATVDQGRCKLGGGEHKMVLQFLEPQRREHTSACSLTRHDMEANVGIAGDSAAPGEIPPYLPAVKAAQAKIETWDEDLNDGQAPLNPEYRGAVTIIAGRGATHVQFASA